jgi:hypothetical protein
MYLQKKKEKKNIFIDIFKGESHCQKEQDPDLDLKCHGSTALVHSIY